MRTRIRAATPDCGRTTARFAAAGRGIAFAAAALLAGDLAAADPDRLRFGVLSRDQGLSDNTVTAVVEDRRGFLWFGTQVGLNRFDGLEFKVFKARGHSPHELAEDYINALHVDAVGRLWIGTFGGGLARYDADAGVFVGYRHAADDPASLRDDDVSALYEDGDGTLWVGTRRGGLDRLDTRSGRLSREQRLSGKIDAVSALAGSGDGGLWIGTPGAGLVRFDPRDGATRHLRADAAPQGLPSDEISALLLDRAGRLWIGTRRSGLARLDVDGRIRHYRHDPARPASLAHDAVNALYQDPAGQVWIGTASGLDAYRSEQDGFRHVRHLPGDRYSLPNAEVLSVFQDSQGALWVGTGAAGAARHAQPSPLFQVHRQDAADPQALGGGGVWSLREDGGGRLWVGTFNGGLYLREPGAVGFRNLRHHPDRPDSLSDDDVRALADSADGSLWVGTRQGLNRYDPQQDRFRRYVSRPDDPRSLANDFVRSLLLDSSGRLWVGTYGGGLDLRQPGSPAFRRFRHAPGDPHSLSSDRVLGLRLDARGELWVATAAGLNRLRRDSGDFERIEGLPNEVVYGIGEDRSGGLWMSSNRGLTRLQPDTGAVRHFPLDDLLSNSEFHGGAVHQAVGGRIHFGGVEGVVTVSPDAEAGERPQPVPVLTDFLAFNRSVPTRAIDPESPLTAPIDTLDRLLLPHDFRMFGFSFAALRASEPNRTRFAYRLDGLDDMWVETAPPLRQATYTNVPPGKYRFRLRVSDLDGHWLPQEAGIDLQVLPPPWRTGWAYTGYALLLAVAVGYMARQRWLRAAQRRLAQQHLRDSEQRLSLALWGSGDELLDWDLAHGVLRRQGGDRSERVLPHLYGTRDLAPHVHPDDFEALRVALDRHLDGDSEHCEATFRSGAHENQWRWQLLRGRVVLRDQQGKALRMAGTQKDISALKAVEAELRELTDRLDARVRDRTRELEQRQLELEASNERLSSTIEDLRRTQSELLEAEKMASLGRLVAGVAHEANTPLGIGVTALSYLREQLQPLRRTLAASPEAARVEALAASVDEAARMAETNIRRAAELVKSFKQVAVDQSASHIRRVRLGEYLQGVLQSLSPALRKAGHQVEIRCDEDVEMVNRPDAIYQIVVNLAMNSLRHAYANGERGRIEIAVAADGDTLHLHYRDDGAGMNAETMERIFEPFYTTKRDAGATGLGMHIVYNLVTQGLHGRIRVHSEPGRGARFEVVFPRLHPQAAGEASKDAGA